jgi:hypothetical protein
VIERVTGGDELGENAPAGQRLECDGADEFLRRA